MPMSLAALGVVLRETVRRNRVRDGLVYLQVTRGAARRDHGFPAPGTAPQVVVVSRPLDPVRAERVAADGIAVITVPDNRWGRVDIKSISLLPNVLAKQAAREKGAREAWFVDAQGFVTEGSSSNAWIVTGQGEVVTRPVDHGILAGISRAVVLDTLAAQGLTLVERPFTRGGGPGGPGGLRDGGEHDRPAGRANRRQAGRQRPSRPDRDRAPARISPPCRAQLMGRRPWKARKPGW